MYRTFGGWRGWLVLTFILTLCTSPAFAQDRSKSTEQPGPTITIWLYNYARVPSGILTRAEKETSRIFRYTGVETRFLHCAPSESGAWEDPNCEQTPSPRDLVVRVLPRSMMGQLELSPNVFGFARSLGEGKLGRLANVFYHRVEAVVRERGFSRAITLGYLVAHELGHLLLGRGSHAQRGLMRCPWSTRELQEAAAGTLLFTPKQARRVRRRAQP